MMNATNEESEQGANITLIATTDSVDVEDANSSSSSTPFYVEYNGVYYTFNLDNLNFDDKSAAGEPVGEQTISFNPVDPQVLPTIYIDQGNPGFGGEIPNVDDLSSSSSDHLILQPPTTTISQEEEQQQQQQQEETNNTVLDQVKVEEPEEENYILDYETISAAKLGGSLQSSSQTDSAEDAEELNTVSDISLSQVSTKLFKLPETPETFISAEIITNGLGYLSKVGFSSARVSKVVDTDGVIVGDSAAGEVTTYSSACASSSSSSSELVRRDDLASIPWNKITLPKSVLLVRHPLIRFRSEQGFADRHYLFPSNTEIQARNLILGVISHSETGLVVNNCDAGSIDQYFIPPPEESNSSPSEDMMNHQQPREEVPPRRQIQLFQIQRHPANSTTMLSSSTNLQGQVVQDHTRWLYAIQPKGSSGPFIVVQSPDNNTSHQSPHQSSHHSSSGLSLATASTSFLPSHNTNPQIHQQYEFAKSPGVTAKGPKAKSCRKSVPKQPKPPKVTKVKQQPKKTKRKKTAATSTTTTIPSVLEVSNNTSSIINGFTTTTTTTNNNHERIGIGNDSVTAGSTTVLLSSIGPDGTLSQRVQCLSSTSSPISMSSHNNGMGEFPQQYFIMSSPNFSQIQTPQLSNNNNNASLNHQMMISNNSSSFHHIQSTATNNRIIQQGYQQPTTTTIQQQQQTNFSMTSINNEQGSPSTMINSNNAVAASTNQFIGSVLPGSIGNVSKLGNGNIVVQVPKFSSSMMRNSFSAGGSPPSMLSTLLPRSSGHNNIATPVPRQPMFSPIQITNNYPYNKGSVTSCSNSSASLKTYSTAAAAAVPQQHHHQQKVIHAPQYSQNSPSPKIRVVVEQAASYSNTTKTTTHARKTNPAHHPHQSQVVVEQPTLTSLPFISSSSPTKDTPVVVEEQEPFTRERFIDGHEAMCKNCGTRSRDLHHCEYCKTRISNEAKLVAVDPSSASNNNTEIPKNYNAPLVQQVTGEPVKKQIKKTNVPRKSRGGGKKHEELIVLSSSEDEDEPKSKVPKSDTTTTPDNAITTTITTTTTNNNMDVNVQSSASNSPAFGGGGVGKEFKINLSPAFSSSASGSSSGTTTSTASHSQSATYLLHDDDMNFEKLIEEIQESLNSTSRKQAAVKVDCRSIRVGDYKCSAPGPQGNDVYTVVFSDRGIMFTIPHAHIKNKAVVCALPIGNILIVEASYKKTLPVIFLATGPRLAKSLRKLLGMSDDPKEQGYHYGPQDGDKCQKRIVFLFTTITEQASGTINKIFGRTLSEIDGVKANQILCDITRDTAGAASSSSPSKKLHIGTSKLPDQASNSSVIMSPSQKQANTNSADLQQPSQVDVSKNKKLLSYQGIDILQQDVLCLADEQFLNDSILDFWLRYIEHEILTPESRDRTYMFSTFFYKRLTTRPKKRPSAIEDDPESTPSEKRHNRVKRWTKNVDIFDKDFLIIPINESLHWFLAVICFPGLLGVHDMTTGEHIPDYQKPKKKVIKTKIKIEPTVPNGFVNNGEDGTTTAEPSTSATAASPSTSSEGTQSQSQENSQDGGSEISKALRIKQPCILVFDSLAGDNRSRVYSTLREYLRMEYKTRKFEDREFTKTSMPGGMPKVPQQPNHCDCGIYTLFYVECFFKWPMSTFDMMSEDYYSIWASQTSCSTKREAIYTSVKELVKQTNPEALSLIPQLTFTPLLIPSTTTRASQLKQIESAPIEKLEKLADGQEPMDIDVVDSTRSAEVKSIVSENTLLKSRSTVESAIIRAIPADNDHDHDYARIPTTTTTTTITTPYDKT